MNLPSKDQCPKKYCFNWLEEGVLYAKGSHESLEDGMKNLKPVEAGSCSRTFGLCKREDPTNGTADYYEPCEPALERDGLPINYFRK